MKALRAVLSFAVLATIIAFSGCSGGKGNPEPLADKQFGLLSKTWKLKDQSGNSVLLETVDSTANWKNFTLTISGEKGKPATYAYKCTGRPKLSVWNDQGSWQFGDCDPTTTDDDVSKEICRDDNAKITYTLDPTGKTLELSFTFTGSGYQGRTANLTGAWLFKLIPTN